jgi:hypothetical protein
MPVMRTPHVSIALALIPVLTVGQLLEAGPLHQSGATQAVASVVPAQESNQGAPAQEVSGCPMEKILSHTGKRLDEFVSNVTRITATEVLVHERLDKNGKPKKRERRKFDYVVLVKETKRGEISIEEFRNGMPGNFGFPGEMAVTGMPALALVFHSDHRTEFEMTCEGLTTWHNREVWPVHFHQKKNQPARMCQIRAGGRAYAVPLIGTAMIDSQSYQIVHLESDLVAPITELRLKSQHQVLDYGPVWFERDNLTLWLPHEADIILDSNGKRFHQRHTFTDFRLFAVDYGQQISAPPEPTPPVPGAAPATPNPSPK